MDGTDQEICYESFSAAGHDHQRSIAACTRLIDSGQYETRELAKLHRNRAIEYREVRKYVEALADIEIAIELRPEHALAWRNKASVLRWLGRSDAALSAIDRAIELNRDAGDGYALKSWILSDLKRFEEAHSAIDLAIALQPGDVWNVRQRGWITHNQAKYGAALDQFREALALDPEDPWTHYALGFVLLDLNRPSEAFNAINRSIELDDGESDFLNLRGYTYLLEGEATYDLAAGTIDLERALQIDPRNEFAYHHLAAAYAFAGDGQRAVSTLKRGVELKPLKDKIRRVIRILYEKGLRSDAAAASALLERSDA